MFDGRVRGDVDGFCDIGKHFSINCRSGIKPDEWKAFTKALKSSDAFSSLEFRKVSIGPDGMKSLTQLVCNSETITMLNFWYCFDIPTNEFADFAKALHESKTFTSLKLYGAVWKLVDGMLWRSLWRSTSL